MRHLILAACCLCGTGCATIFKGSNEKVSFSTEPENASVYVNGMYSGKGAFQQNLASNGTYAVECRRPGFEAKSQTINHAVGAGWIILDVLGGFVPLIIDAATGSWNQLDNTTVRCSLEQAEVEKVPPPAPRSQKHGVTASAR
jgi:hypothetical protein